MCQPTSPHVEERSCARWPATRSPNASRIAWNQGRSHGDSRCGRLYRATGQHTSTCMPRNTFYRASKLPTPGPHLSAPAGSGMRPSQCKTTSAPASPIRRTLIALRTARTAGTTETQARLDGLRTVMATLQDRTPLHSRPGRPAPRVHRRAPVPSPETGDTAAPAGAETLTALDADLRARSWSPRGSTGLLAGVPVPGRPSLLAAEHSSRAAGRLVSAAAAPRPASKSIPRRDRRTAAAPAGAPDPLEDPTRPSARSRRVRKS